MTFDRAKFEQEMEELKKIPVLMNEEWELAEAMDNAAASDAATEAELESSSKRD